MLRISYPSLLVYLGAEDPGRDFSGISVINGVSKNFIFQGTKPIKRKVSITIQNPYDLHIKWRGILKISEK